MSRMPYGMEQVQETAMMCGDAPGESRLILSRSMSIVRLSDIAGLAGNALGGADKEENCGYTLLRQETQDTDAYTLVRQNTQDTDSNTPARKDSMGYTPTARDAASDTARAARPNQTSEALAAIQRDDVIKGFEGIEQKGMQQEADVLLFIPPDIHENIDELLLDEEPVEAPHHIDKQQTTPQFEEPPLEILSPQLLISMLIQLLDEHLADDKNKGLDDEIMDNFYNGLLDFMESLERKYPIGEDEAPPKELEKELHFLGTQFMSLCRKFLDLKQRRVLGHQGIGSLFYHVCDSVLHSMLSSASVRRVFPICRSQPFFDVAELAMELLHEALVVFLEEERNNLPRNVVFVAWFQSEVEKHLESILLKLDKLDKIQQDVTLSSQSSTTVSTASSSASTSAGHFNGHPATVSATSSSSTFHGIARVSSSPTVASTQLLVHARTSDSSANIIWMPSPTFCENLVKLISVLCDFQGGNDFAAGEIDDFSSDDFSNGSDDDISEAETQAYKQERYEPRLALHRLFRIGFKCSKWQKKSQKMDLLSRMLIEMGKKLADKRDEVQFSRLLLTIVGCIQTIIVIASYDLSFHGAFFPVIHVLFDELFHNALVVCDIPAESEQCSKRSNGRKSRLFPSLAERSKGRSAGEHKEGLANDVWNTKLSLRVQWVQKVAATPRLVRIFPLLEIVDRVVKNRAKFVSGATERKITVQDGDECYLRNTDGKDSLREDNLRKVESEMSPSVGREKKSYTSHSVVDVVNNRVVDFLLAESADTTFFYSEILRLITKDFYAVDHERKVGTSNLSSLANADNLNSTASGVKLNGYHAERANVSISNGLISCAAPYTVNSFFYSVLPSVEMIEWCCKRKR